MNSKMISWLGYFLLIGGMGIVTLAMAGLGYHVGHLLSVALIPCFLPLLSHVHCEHPRRRAAANWKAAAVAHRALQMPSHHQGACPQDRLTGSTTAVASGYTQTRSAVQRLGNPLVVLSLQFHFHAAPMRPSKPR
jgi:hypothetical protein